MSLQFSMTAAADAGLEVSFGLCGPYKVREGTGTTCRERSGSRIEDALKLVGAADG